MLSVLRLVGSGDRSKLGLVAHALGRSFNYEIEPFEGALTCRKDAMTVRHEVLRFSLVRPSTELQRPVEPDSQQGRDMRAAVRSNGRQPIHLGPCQLSAGLRPLRRGRFRAAEGAQLGHRNRFSHTALPSRLLVRAATAILTRPAEPIVAHAPMVPQAGILANVLGQAYAVQGRARPASESASRFDGIAALLRFGPTDGNMLPGVVELNPVEARVIGSLAEKQLTTPQQYPLTLNALVLACNQSSNRDPVVAYDETTVELALSSLKEAGLLRFVHPGKGASATRYRQVLDERLGLDSPSLSVLTVLMLRGPQTVGELRTRTERMADFSNLEHLEAELERLGGGMDPLVRRLPRRPGQKEERWAQLFTDATPEPGGTSDPQTGVIHAVAQGRSVPLSDEVAALRDDVDVLQAEVAKIKGLVEELRAAFDL